MTANQQIENPELDGSAFFWQGGQDCILLIHGFTATSVEIRPLAKFFHQAGYSVVGPLLPGHGTTVEDLNSRTWKEWTAAADQCYQLCRSTYRRVFVGGESLGGLLSLYLASIYPEISGIMLYAPALKVKNLWRAGIARFFISSQKKKLKGASKKPFPWQGYKVFPIKAAYQLYLIQKEINSRLKLVHQPALIMQGEKDRTIIPISSQIIFDDINSQRKELVWLRNSGHCVVLDQEYEQVMAKSLSFVASNLVEQGAQLNDPRDPLV